jgi:peptidoglycan/xylan/chitin deacetylase (PgdA/CDA1 family)
LTFDDGYTDAYMHAYPILKDFGFTGTFFLITDFIDTREPGYLSWDQVKEMAESGMVIGDHSRTHKDMRNRDHDWLIDEIAVPRDRIEGRVGVRPRYFCYPSGEFDEATVREVRDAGFAAAFTTQDGTYTYTDNMLRIPRVRMRGTTSLAAFAQLMTWER